jgi:hypothetical protein
MLGLAVHFVAKLVGFRYELGRERARNASVLDLGLGLSPQPVGFVRSAAHVAFVQ